jgi:hypothetical protein
MVIENQDAANRRCVFAQSNRPRNYHKDSGAFQALRIRRHVKSSLTCVTHDQNETLRSLFEHTGCELMLASRCDISIVRFHLYCVTPPDFNAASFSLVHHTCSQDANDEEEHRIKYNEPDRRVCHGRPMRFESYLWLHILSSAEPELINNAQYNEGESAPDNDNFFNAALSNRRGIIVDFRITTKQLIAAAVNENAGAQ